MSVLAIKPGNTAVISGGAAGIGLATALRLASRGMAVTIVDIRDELFSAATTALRDAGAADVLCVAADVADRAAVQDLHDQVIDRFGHVDLLMSNAAIQPGSDIFDSRNNWERIIGVNLWGVVNMCQRFVPGMMTSGRAGTVINTGSKQGITAPPGDPAYNITKAGVKTFTEALAHEIRETGAPVSTHLLIPGFVFSDLTRNGRSEKPDGAWTPDQCAEFLMTALQAGDFYVLCPDNDVSRDMDEKRMEWAMGDIIENRPPLSRWHPDWAGKFAAFMDKP